jgi:uncharacterized delta-60 repeat protein
MAKNQSTPGSSHPQGLSEALTPGVRVGGARYILRRILGRGGLTVVWLARDFKLEQEVALKVLPQSLLQDANAVERLKTETRRSLQLAHPQIVRTYDFIQDQGLAAIAMEYVDGWSLATLRVDRSQQRYRLAEITPWVRQICAALTYAHTEAGILHLALKPANLMLNSRDQLKLTDFGIARSLQAMAAPTDLNPAAGALGFLSPQLALGEKPSVLDDVYALGATIYDLLTGTPPFYKGQVLAQICDRPPPGMTERLFELGIEDSIPLVVEDTIALCLAKDPAKRPPSISRVLQLLERSDVPAPASTPQPEQAESREQPAPPPPLSDSQAPAAPPEVVEPGEAPAPARLPKPWNRRKSILAAVAVCALALAGALGGWWTIHSAKRLLTTAARAGSRDTAFNPATNADNEIRVALEQPDRKILIGGMFTQFGHGPHQGIARLQPDGALDETFTATAVGYVHALALQPDAKLLLAGEFTSVNGQACHRIARLNPDGSLDQSFNLSVGVGQDLRAVLVQPDGHILAGGHFNNVAGRRQGGVARFNSDGSRDATFHPGAGTTAFVWSLALQADGKILAGGAFETFNRKPCRRLVRLESDGTVDAAFGTGSGADATVFAVALQADGKILVGGDFTRINQVERNRIARLNPDGSVDMTFNPGAGPNTGVRCLALPPDGKILIGGVFTSVDGVARNRIARLKPDGSLDPSFDPGAGANEVVRWVAPQADGKVVIVGGFSRFAGSQCVRLARLHGGPR